ncbi:hypothetical protein Droror1_Dr00022247 [Drosera rotundifolia]
MAQIKSPFVRSPFLFLLSRCSPSAAIAAAATARLNHPSLSAAPPFLSLPRIPSPLSSSFSAAATESVSLPRRSPTPPPPDLISIRIMAAIDYTNSSFSQLAI